VIVQDEATSVVWGMPGYIYAAGQADGMYPLKQLERQVTRRVIESCGGRAAAWNESSRPPQNAEVSAVESLKGPGPIGCFGVLRVLAHLHGDDRVLVVLLIAFGVAEIHLVAVNPKLNGLADR
jgi:hypothetical protein